MEKTTDLLIIGAGPYGLAMAAYARVEVGVLEQRVRELEARLAQREAATPEASSDGSERAPLKRLRP